MLQNTIDAGAEFDSLFASASESTLPNHFATDCLWIAAECEKSPESIVGIVALAMSSIQQPFYLMPMQLERLKVDGITSPYLFGAKRGGLFWAIQNWRSLWDAAERFKAGKLDLTGLVIEYMRCPSLGIVKASFVAQMTVGDGACLDTLNLRDMGREPGSIRSPKKVKPATLAKHVDRYNRMWRQHGDSAHWWNLWCENVGNRTHNHRGASIPGFDNAAHVSRTHRLAVERSLISALHLESL